MAQVALLVGSESLYQSNTLVNYVRCKVDHLLSCEAYAEVALAYYYCLIYASHAIADSTLSLSYGLRFLNSV